MISTERLPLPYTSKKIKSIVMAKSVLPSWAIGQNPFSRNSGHFVVIKETIIMINNGITASRVNNPMITRREQTISKKPVKFAQNKGGLIPSFANRPLPRSSGYKNFWMPSDRNIRPTVRRIIRVGNDFVWKNLFMLTLVIHNQTMP